MAMAMELEKREAKQLLTQGHGSSINHLCPYAPKKNSGLRLAFALTLDLAVPHSLCARVFGFESSGEQLYGKKLLCVSDI